VDVRGQVSVRFRPKHRCRCASLSLIALTRLTSAFDPLPTLVASHTMAHMRRLHLFLVFAGIVSWGCDRRSEFITETSPFASVTVLTPRDGMAAIARRATRFAEQRRMKVHFVPDHFEPHELTLSLTRADLNIIAGNVMSGDRLRVTATARAAPTSAQRSEVDAYLCEVMRHGCPR
jgi:hypothetical protein